MGQCCRSMDRLAVVTGANGKYTGATSVLRGLVYGRLAGRHAAEFAAKRQRNDHPT